MKKLACVLTAVSLLGVATPASAQYFYAGGDGFAVGIGAGPGYGYGWGGPYGYGSEPYAYGGSYAYDGSWDGPYYRDSYAYGSRPYGWGGPSYTYAGYNYDASRGYGYDRGWWRDGYRSGGPGFRGYVYSPSYRSYAYAPGCRIVKMRRHLGDGTVVVRRTRVC